VGAPVILDQLAAFVGAQRSWEIVVVQDDLPVA
jgi:hypothetical protein